MVLLNDFPYRGKFIKVAQAIGPRWNEVGIALLEDEFQSIMPALAQEHGKDAENINIAVLGRWVRGEGMRDRTWRGLLTVLKKHCVMLAERMEETLTGKVANPPTTQEPTHTSSPSHELEAQSVVSYIVCVYA